MNNEIIISLIGFAGVLVGGIFGYLGRSRKQAIIDARREQKQNDNWKRVLEEMTGIKQRLDQHNKYAEKFGDIEKSITAIKKDIEYLRRDMDEKAKKS